MLHARIIGCWRGTNFENGEEAGRITLSLPDGPTVEADVPLEYLGRLTELFRADRGVTTTASSEQDEPAKESAGSPAANLILWQELPEEELPHQVKLAMANYGLPSMLPEGKIVQIRDTILTEYTEADWATLAQKTDARAPMVAKRSAPAKPQAQGAIEWTESTVMAPSVPSRTVPRDSMGYPIVKQTAPADPGEVQVSAEDDDGVATF